MSPHITNGTGYGWTGAYGTGCYKGDKCVEPTTLKRLNLIEQFASPVINSSTIDFIPYVPSYNVNPSNDITPTEHILISQFRNGVIN